ncbi:MAG: FAD-dependent oxidoreductase [Planctomycetes bacterium]|nr:FAD-dependent oxidoreductase [Planctomycetota bacterium]
MKRWIPAFCLATMSIGSAGAADAPVDAGTDQLSGIVVDDQAAQYMGDWVASAKQPPRVGTAYRHDNATDRGNKSARFTIALPEAGRYEVRLIYTPHENRATNARVTIAAADGEKTLTVNQRVDPYLFGVPRALGEFSFVVGEPAVVIVSNDHADGYVVIDAVQIVPSDVAQAERAAAKAERDRWMGPIQLAQSASPEEVAARRYDLLVVGGTPGGIACAVRAAREGLSVLLVQHNGHLGGMMTNGLMQWDALYAGHRAPLFSELLRNIDRYYRAIYGRHSHDYQAVHFTGEHYPLGMVEPHVAEREFNRLVAAEDRITVLLHHFPTSVDRQGTRLRRVTLGECGRSESICVEAAMFADATYEGDLAALAGIPYRVGREGRDEYDEPHAGKLFTNIVAGPAPRDAVEGRLNLHPYSSRQGSIDPDSPRTADGAVQAYNFRFCVSCDPENRILPAAPPNYRREEYVDYERKYIAARPGPNQKSHMNSPILPGENHEYPDADWPTRRRIARRHLEFALGLMYFLQNDKTIPDARRESFRRWGLPKDEFADNDHVPYEMYVREARRIVGRHVYSQHDNSLAPGLGRTPVHPDSVAITDWYMDSHACTTETRPGYKYDGKLILTEQSRPGQIPYRCLLPPGVDNLLVPVCLSATHVAWGAVRLEPVWMQTGEAAGFAAALSKRHATVPGDLESDLLVRTLAENRLMISFFNDVRVDGDQPWIVPVQYFGTKGFFADYDARPETPLGKQLAAIWIDGFFRLLSGDLNPGKLARQVAEVNGLEDAAIGVNEFERSISKSAAGQGGEPGPILTRGEAMQRMWSRLKKGPVVSPSG